MLQLVNIGKIFGSQFQQSSQHIALYDVNLKIHDGEFFSLLGPSGCGKTTLLRIISGLESLSSGQILLDGKAIQDLTPQQRPFNMVFQRYALFPHLTVEENLGFGLEIKGVSKNDRKLRVTEALNLVGLEEFRNRYPDTLSGGQAQRVALARALVNRPKVLLLDEPLSALDLKMREYMQRELRALQKKLGLTFIYVTHDQDEALTLSDRIGVMNRGRLEQVSTPKELYEKPKTIFAAQFVGSMSQLQGEIVELNDQAWTMRLASGSLVSGPMPDREIQMATGSQVQAFIRPERIELFSSSAGMGSSKGLASSSGQNPKTDNCLFGHVAHCIFRGDQYETHIESPAAGLIRVISSQSPAPEIEVGSSVLMRFAPEHIHIFSAQAL